MTITMSIALLILRLGVGLTLAGHGLQKLFGWVRRCWSHPVGTEPRETGLHDDTSGERNIKQKASNL